MLYSKRNKVKTVKLTTVIGNYVRKRIICTLKHDAEQNIATQYGVVPTNELQRRNIGIFVECYLLECSDEEVLDYIEMFFESRNCNCQKKSVVSVNSIFREESVGYYFTEFHSDIGVYPKAIKVE